AATSRDVEHAIAGAHSRQLDQPIVDRLRGSLECGPPSLPPLRAVVPRGLLLALNFQIIGILIAHRSFTFAVLLRRAAARPFADIPFYTTRRRPARGSDRQESKRQPAMPTDHTEPHDRADRLADNTGSLRSHTTALPS